MERMRCAALRKAERSCTARPGPALPCAAGPAAPALPSRQDIEDLPVVDGVGQLLVLLPRRHRPLPRAAVDERVGVLQRRPAARARAHHGCGGAAGRKEPGRRSGPHRERRRVLGGAGPAGASPCDSALLRARGRRRGGTRAARVRWSGAPRGGWEAAWSGSALAQLKLKLRWGQRRCKASVRDLRSDLSVTEDR